VIRPAEMVNLFKASSPVALLYAPVFTEKVEAIKAMCAEHDNVIAPGLPFVEIETIFPTAATVHRYVAGAMDRSLTSRLGSLFFTSGTSGNQKGVIHSHEALIASARERIDTWKLSENDVVLNQKPGNWIGGIFPILPALMAGACLSVRTFSFYFSFDLKYLDVVK
jgi:malonyl-CoA/methylmalonyl-CoA synthetase